MTNRHRFFLHVYFCIYIASLIIVCACFIFDIKIVLGIVSGLLFLCVCVTLFFLAPSIHIARKKYKEMPPIQLYNSLLSKENYCRLEVINKNLVSSILLLEDISFYSHKGICIKGIINAMIHNLYNNNKHGGSTISQQLVKNVYLSHEKTIKRKIAEILIVFMLERNLSKNQILEMYINVIYYGCQQFGIYNAAQYYYHCSPDQLSLIQCISLAAILPCPDKYNEKVNPVLFRSLLDDAIIKYMYITNTTFMEMCSLCK